MNPLINKSSNYRINKRLLWFVCIAFALTCQTFAETKGLLTLQKRDELEKAIESVYWKHRIWPKENKSSKPSLDELISSPALNNRVLSNVRKSAVLKSLFHTSITPEEVQAEIDRMVQETKDPQMLSEIFSVLGNDPNLIADVLAYPLLVETKIRKLFAFDERFHGIIRERAESDLKRFGTPERLAFTSGKYLETIWIKNDAPSYADPEEFHLTSEQWEEFRKKLRRFFSSSANEHSILPQRIVSPLQEDESKFFVVSILEESEDRIILGTVYWNKIPFDEWWSETEPSIQVPAQENEPYEYDADLPAFRSIACSNDAWKPTAQPPEPNAPFGRGFHVSFWTGAEMIVWSGWDGIAFTNTGARYYPATNSWLPTSLINAPNQRHSSAAVWTGTEMIVWNGIGSLPPGSGGRYDPASDTWTSTSLTNIPQDRHAPTAVWTGSEMIIWGGQSPTADFVNTGGRYNPSTNTWLATSLAGAPNPRYRHTAVWTGNKMIIWGGTNGSYLSSGGRYDPEFDTWQTTTFNAAPEHRERHSAVWSGNEMIIWGGIGVGGIFLNSGAKYDPVNDSWSPTSTVNVPNGRLYNTAIWSEDEMIVWSGYKQDFVLVNSGGRYNPGTDQWTEISQVNAPDARNRHTAVWTGKTMIIWGGFENIASGGIYYPNPNSNLMPISSDDDYDAVEDSTLNITQPGVLSNDTDPDLDSLTAVIASSPLNGDAILNSDGSFVYTPSANFNGQDSFTYQAFDGLCYSIPSTVTLNVESVNDAPVVNNDSYSGEEDSQILIPAAGVLSNDTDIENDALNATLVSGPSSGQLNLNSDGSFNYVPQPNFSGADTFTYIASDGQLFSNPALVTITINPINDAPAGVNDSFITQEDVALSIDPPGVLNNDTDIDGDPLTASLVSGPTHGNLFLNAYGSFTFSPFANFNGTDSFTYKANDGTTDSNLVTVNISVESVNDLPIAENESYSMNEDSALNVNTPGVLGNDLDSDGDTLSAILVNPTSNGNLVLNSNGSFVYTPVANFNGSDSFTYVSNDGFGDSNPAIVTILVDPVNDSPVAQNESYVLQEDETLNIVAPGVLSNDTDIDNDPLQATLDSAPPNGALSLNADGSFTYTPNSNFNGTDNFTYKSFDGIAFSNVALVTIAIIPVNDNPVVVDDNVTVDQNSSNNIIDVLANDSDQDGDALTIIAITQGTNGTVIIVNDEVSYTPDPDFNGNDKFSYTISDGNGGIVVGFVNVTVEPPDCLFCDEFENNVLDPNWSYIKPDWTESGGMLLGNPVSRKAKAVAVPIFEGCRICSVETQMQSAGGSLNKVWLLSWYLDKDNTIELLMNEESDRWILKQRVNRRIVAKAKNTKLIEIGIPYKVQITFDGTQFKVFVDDFTNPLITLTPPVVVPSGSVGFQVKNTVASFYHITVNN